MPGEIVINMSERMIREIREDIERRFGPVCEELELLRKMELAARELGCAVNKAVATDGNALHYGIPKFNDKLYETMVKLDAWRQEAKG